MTSASRRSFLRICGGSPVLAYWLGNAVRRAEGAERPKRFMVLHRPNGSVAENWLSGTSPGPILKPFVDAGVWPYAVALKGVDVRPSNGSTGGSHESGLVTIMTGARLGATYRTNDDFRSTAESLDQTLLKKAAVLGGTRVPSLQVAAHGDQDGGNEIPNTALTYSGAERPVYPELKPDAVYSRLFGGIMPGGGGGEAEAALAKARARRKSALDFVKWDLARARTQFPTEYKQDLDSHEAAVREVEKTLDGTSTTPPAMCTQPTITAGMRGGGDYLNMERVGAAHLKLVTAAFQCDLTRVATFMWATGASLVSFGPLGTNNHHSTSHANNRAVLARVDTWFSEKTAAFIKQLVDTPDPAGGKLIDHTLVWYINEVSEGASHSFNDYPFVLFGGDGVGMKQRGRVHDVSGQGKTSNDVWSALAPVYGTTLGPYGTKAGGAITGLFT